VRFPEPLQSLQGDIVVKRSNGVGNGEEGEIRLYRVKEGRGNQISGKPRLLVLRRQRTGVRMRLASFVDGALHPTFIWKGYECCKQVPPSYEFMSSRRSFYCSDMPPPLSNILNLQQQTAQNNIKGDRTISLSIEPALGPQVDQWQKAGRSQLLSADGLDFLKLYTCGNEVSDLTWPSPNGFSRINRRFNDVSTPIFSNPSVI